jgi:hypothetical protein
MRTIIRCPNCFTYVYSDARRCHGCGQKTGKRKLLPRGSWIFAILAVAGFTLARGIDMHQDKMSERRHQIQTAENVEKVSAFVRTWLSAPADTLGSYFTSGKPFAGELTKLRAKYPKVLPAEVVGSVKVEELRDEIHHFRNNKDSQVAHNYDASKGALRVSRKPPGRESALQTWRSWWSTPFQFEGEVTKDGVGYTVHGQVCVYDGSITCLAIDRVESLEGIVNPEN